MKTENDTKEHYIIYCDESKAKGRFCSNFYGGALIKASDRQAIEAGLKTATTGIIGEAKWTKIGEETEEAYSVSAPAHPTDDRTAARLGPSSSPAACRLHAS
jgi:hypothetical protein